MKLLFIYLLSFYYLGATSSLATTEASYGLSKSCENVLIKSAVSEKRASFRLDYSFENIVVSQDVGTANVIGQLSDPDEDYFYRETFLVTFYIRQDKTCVVDNIQIYEVFDNGDVEYF